MAPSAKVGRLLKLVYIVLTKYQQHSVKAVIKNGVSVDVSANFEKYSFLCRRDLFSQCQRMEELTMLNK